MTDEKQPDMSILNNPYVLQLLEALCERDDKIADLRNQVWELQSELDQIKDD